MRSAEKCYAIREKPNLSVFAIGIACLCKSLGHLSKLCQIMNKYWRTSLTRRPPKLCATNKMGRAAAPWKRCVSNCDVQQQRNEMATSLSVHSAFKRFDACSLTPAVATSTITFALY